MVDNCLACMRLGFNLQSCRRKEGRPTKVTICSPGEHPSSSLTSSLERGPEPGVPGWGIQLRVQELL